MAAEALPDDVRAEIEHALGAPVTAVRRVGGGDINDAWAMEVGGRRAFVKSREGAEADAFTVEAEGLRWLSEARALRTPEVLAVSEDPPLLVLEFVATGRPAPDTAEALGRGLAALHRAAPPSFGLPYDNLIARLRQWNAPCATWPEFYWERRLEPMLRRVERARLGDAALRRDLERLAARLPERCGPAEPPARLHGDLWAGNLLVDEAGAPVLVDPAVYGGHREVDLAMMQLFGGFEPRVLEAYAEAWPLSPGWDERVPLYQLYPLLVHVCLFGAGYLGPVRQALRKLL